MTRNARDNKGAGQIRVVIPLTEYYTIFRVPEYSEWELRSGSVIAFHQDVLGILKRGEETPAACRQP